MSMTSSVETNITLKAFQRIASRWSVGPAEAAALIGVSPRELNRWQDGEPPAGLASDQTERISYVLGIFSGLHSVLGDVAFADEWVRRPNADFGGRTPLERMLAGNVGGLEYVRDYVDRWVAGLPGLAVPTPSTYAIMLDLSVEELLRIGGTTTLPEAIAEVQKILEEDGFTQRAGFLFVGQVGKVNAVSCVLAAQRLARELPWFSHCVRDFRMLRIEEQTDLMPAFEVGGIS